MDSVCDAHAQAKATFKVRRRGWGRPCACAWESRSAPGGACHFDRITWHWARNEFGLVFLKVRQPPMEPSGLTHGVTQAHSLTSPVVGSTTAGLAVAQGRRWRPLWDWSIEQVGASNKMMRVQNKWKHEGTKQKPTRYFLYQFYVKLIVSQPAVETAGLNQTLYRSA